MGGFIRITSYNVCYTKLLRRNRTTFIVAHRLSTIRKASRIVVMKAGRIEEVGTYDDLMARRGFFYEMHRLQH